MLSECAQSVPRRAPGGAKKCALDWISCGAAWHGELLAELTKDKLESGQVLAGYWQVVLSERTVG